MADVKITNLDTITGSLAGTDLIPIAEDPSGTPKTVKITVGDIVPAGGAEDAILIKSTSVDYDAEWKAPFLSRVAVLEWRGLAGVNGPTLSSGALRPVLYDDFVVNDIPGLSKPTAGSLKFPIGKILINMTLYPSRTDYTRLYIRKGANIVMAGPATRIRNATYEAGIVTLNGVLTVTSIADTYELLVSVTTSQAAGVHDRVAYATYETYGQVFIQQLSD